MWSTRLLRTTPPGIATSKPRWTMMELGTSPPPNHGKVTPFIGLTSQVRRSFPGGRWLASITQRLPLQASLRWAIKPRTTPRAASAISAQERTSSLSSGSSELAVFSSLVCRLVAGSYVSARGCIRLLGTWHIHADRRDRRPPPGYGWDLGSLCRRSIPPRSGADPVLDAHLGLPWIGDRVRWAGVARMGLDSG